MSDLHRDPYTCAANLARENGVSLSIVFPLPDELFIDIDNPA